uniref:Head-to-tail adaptor n=1 Tax=Streptomyces sp. NBC_00093 TaxID=2975649 RepID=A0AAU2A1P8_9ACTN
MAAATANELRLFLRHPGAFTEDETAQAELLIELAEGEVDDVTGQSLALAEDTVVLDAPTRQDPWPDLPGTGTFKLVLPRWPVTAVASVTILNDTEADEELEYGADHDYTWSAAGILTRVNSWWPTWDRSVEVVYTAGHDPYPIGAKRIVLRMAAAAWGNPMLLASESLGDHSRSFSAEALGMSMSDKDRKLLGLYRART